jgi:LuxR family quorum sensing-dependent transcriptional regulator
MPKTLAAFDLMEQIAQAPTVSTAWSIYYAAAKRAGFSGGAACGVPADMVSQLTVFAHDLPSGWSERYRGENYSAIDPVSARANNSPRPFEWKLEDWKTLSMPLQRQWRDDVCLIGYSGGFVVPERSSGDLMVITLTSEFGERDPCDRMTLHFAGIETLIRMREIEVSANTKPRTHLSSRECECLKWVAVGKTDWEIGVILSISEKTVNVYVDRAKQKLGVQTRAQAIVLATRGRLITV